MYHIQSLQFRLNYIIVGTRSGDIYFLQIPDGTEELNAENKQALIQKVYSAHDNE